MYQNTTEGALAAGPGGDHAADEGVRSTLAALLARLLPEGAQVRVGRRTFVEMGANSLTFMEISQAVGKTFGIDIPIGRFFHDLTSPEALEDFIATGAATQPIPGPAALPMDEPVSAAPSLPLEEPGPLVGMATIPSPATATQATPAGEIAASPIFSGGPAPTLTAPATELEGIMTRQLQAVTQAVGQVVTQQLEFLRGTSISAPAAPPPPAPAASPPPAVSWPPARPTKAAPVRAVAEAGTPFQARPVTPRQQQYLDGFIAAYNKRTRTSKHLAQSHHRILADVRSILGFSPEIKELYYPIFAEHSGGARFRDLDGNDYLDIAMGSGVYLFGHNPPFVAEALQGQLQKGIQLGPQSPLAGEVAELVCEMTGMERVAFCCSGTEAVITALRLARAARGRDKIVTFTGSYHGHSDSTLVIPRILDGAPVSTPMVPGVSAHSAEDVIVLDYDAPRSLETIAAVVDELGAVLVEPVQSRRPDLQPRAFLQELRRLTREHGIPLIFDEMITGFRLHPGGAQGWFGIQADLATYGKVVGGGMPIGIVAGKAEFLDWIDGGTWNYQDDTLPSAQTTYAAGTFRKHPLAMAASKAVLLHLKGEGEALQERLNRYTRQLANTLNDFFAGEELPLKMVHCGSLFRFVMDDNYSYMYQPLAMDLFYYHLIAAGVYFWEGRTCFLTTAHTEKDTAELVAAVSRSCEILQDHEFLPRRADRLHRERTAAGAAKMEDTGVRITKAPLKDDQRHLRLLHEIDGEGSLAYQNFLSYKLRGDLDLDLVRRCVQQVFDRHDALRTVICRDEDAQKILPAMPITIPLTDLSSLAPTEREKRLAAWFSEESHTPLDIYEGPLARVRLVKIAEDVHVLTLTAHHIVIDGWSMSLMITEICQLYIAAKQGVPAALEPPYQFSAYLHRYAERMQTPEMAAHEAYWMGKFRNSIPVLNLPTDYPTPVLRKFRGSRRTSRIDRQLIDEMQQIAGEHGCTLFMTLMSVYFILLHRLTWQPDIVVGVPSGGRSFEGGGRLVGYCTSMMAIRHRVDAQLPFSEYLYDFKQVALEAFSHDEYPFARLNDKLLMRPGSKHSSIVSVTFNMEPVLPQPELPGIEAELLSHPIAYAGVDLLLNCTEDNGDLILDLDYNSGLFAAETADRLLDQFHTILEAVASDPMEKVIELPLLNAAERHRLLVEWNPVDRGFAPTGCLHELFEQQAAARPEAIALICAQEPPLTYRQLNVRANQLAHYLQEQGAGPETLVGICLERGTDLVVGLLAILKAGAAYVPLDPTYPRERIAFTLDDAQVEILITHRKLVERLGTPIAHLCCVDEIALANEGAADTNPQAAVIPENLAYVLYTSGSTGRPKGVAITHRSARALIHWALGVYASEELRAVLASTSLCFDLSVFELFAPLSSGNSVILARNALALSTLPAAGQVTLVNTVPSAMVELIRQDALPGSVRTVNLAGEPLKPALVDQLYGREGTERVYDLYGPSEDTTYSTYALRRKGGPATIGRPVSNTQIYILDPELNPLPVGAVGELYTGGAGLARGYLNRPDLTAEGFIPDPFSGTPGQRLYRTGDLARFLPDGKIIFLGRRDHQVKLRGFRIELGEIETALVQSPTVREAVVLVREDNPGDKRLVAYIVAKSETEPDVAALRAHLKKQLPEYMVPATYVFLDALPLTPNGKIDREALPAPTEEVSRANYQAPRTPIEEMLAAIFADVLGADQVGRSDDFFERGGHSLLAAMAVTRIQESFNVRLEPRRMFESPTVVGLAAYIEAELKAQQAPARPPIPATGHDDDLPLSFAQERMWFIDRLWADITTYNLLYGMRVKGPLDVDALQQSLAEIVRRHAILRTIYPTTSESPRQRILPDPMLELPVIDLQNRPAAEQAAEIESEVQQEALRPFDLGLECPLRARLLRVGPDNQVVLLTFHHIAFDGWSEGVLNRELAALYQAFAMGLPSPLAPLPIQYADFAVWQRTWLTDEVLQGQIGYWKQELQDAPGLLQLPYTLQPPVHKTFRGAAEEFEIGAPLAHGLRTLGRRSGTTLYTTLLGAYVSLLSGYSGQRTMVVNTPVVSRQPLELEPLIGFFVSTMMIRADLSGNPTFLELLTRLHAKTLAGYGFDDVPFGQLLGDSASSTDLERTPLLHLMFNLVNVPTGQLAVGDLAITSLEAEGIVAHPSFTLYDLALSLRDTQEGLYGELRYGTDLFDATAVKRILADLEGILHAVVENPSRRVAELGASLPGPGHRQ